MFVFTRKARVMAIACTALAIAVIASTSCAAATAKPVTDFPLVQGQGGYFVQGFNPTTGAWTDLAATGSYWFSNPSDQWGIPLAGLAAGQLVMHPGGGDAGPMWAVVSYQAPAAGFYAYGLTFADGAGGTGATTRALAFINGDYANPLSEGTVTATASANLVKFDAYLNAGDYLRFAVDPMGSFAYDSTVVQEMIIQPLPEPGTWAALLMGIAGTGLSVLRRRNS